MRVLVIGAANGIGREVVAQALARDIEVRAFSRSEIALPDGPSLEKVQGDATRAEDLRGALPGVDVVVLTVGLGRDPRRFFKPITLFSDTAAALLPAMAKTGPKRLLVVTGFGAGDSSNAMSMIERLGHRTLLGRAYADKDIQEDMIRGTELDWTIVRPVILTNSAATGRYRVLSDPADWRNGMISRADVAHYLIEAASSGANSRQTVVLTR